MTDIQDIIFAGLRAVQTSEGGNVSNMINNIINQSCVDTNGTWQPFMDMIETENYIKIFMDIPNVKKESISVEFFNDNITVSGNKLNNIKVEEEKVEKFIISEIVYGKFKRDIKIPISVTNKTNTKVYYNNGLLSIIVDKLREKENTFTFTFKDDIHTSDTKNTSNDT